MIVNKYKWYLNRLKSMSINEYFYRFNENKKTSIYRNRFIKCSELSDRSTLLSDRFLRRLLKNSNRTSSVVHLQNHNIP